jgi:hypothetical protein
MWRAGRAWWRRRANWARRAARARSRAASLSFSTADHSSMSSRSASAVLALLPAPGHGKAVVPVGYMNLDGIPPSSLTSAYRTWANSDMM